MSVTETFVKDHLDFFRIFSEASLDLAFSIPWQIVNVPDLRLEPPYWMSFIDYQTFGTWVLCCIEKSIWLHYFHANDCQVRKNYLGTFFYDWSQVESRKYRHQVI